MGRADREAYAIIGDKQVEALGEAREFDIETEVGALTGAILEATPRLPLGEDEFTTPARLISLSETVTLALANNREYQNRKETLFGQSLVLSTIRYDFGNQYSAGGSAGVTRTQDPLNVEKFGDYGVSAGVTRLLATGARVSLNITHDWVRFFYDDPRDSASNALSLGIVQPLLRGAGALVTMEPLRQGERNMIYAVRDFQRFQQSFIIQIVQTYYSLLGSLDRLDNAAQDLRNSQDDLQKLEALSGGWRARPDIEVDQARQRLLQAEANLTQTRNAYARQLDNFKLFLGLPIDLDLGPDPAELRAIAERGLLRPDLTLEDAVSLALEQRLDFMTRKDALEDTRRSFEITRRDLWPSLDLTFDVSTDQQLDEDRLRFDFENNREALGLNLDLPLDWTPRRNRVRDAMIETVAAERELEEARDQLILEVREAWRGLEESRTLYRIQVESVRLAERQVEQTTIMLQMGRAIARDLLEAQDSLLQARNAQTQALVDHTILRLQFWNAIEQFEVHMGELWEATDAPS